MSEVRIPVSLKFETESDVYKDLIIELRDNRELSPFIVQLLTFYYEDDEVRDLVNFKREKNNPFSALKEQVAKINMQHTKTIMGTNMLASQTQGIISGLKREGFDTGDNDLQSQQADDSSFTMSFGDEQQPQEQPSQQQINHQQPTNPSANDVLLERMDKMEKLLPDIMDRLDQLLTGNKPQQAVQQAPVPLSVVQPTQQQPIIQVAPPTIQIEAQPEAPPITIGQPEPSIAPSIAPVEEEAPTKPASFGKALGSLKKK